MKKCKQGYYYCYTDKKCKRIPLGYRVASGGYLRKENGEESGEDGDNNGNGNGNGGNGNGNGGNGNGNGGGNGGGVSEGTLHKWFKGSKSKDDKSGWVNVVTGGTCASDEPGEGTPKCVSSAKRASMSKAERLSAARRKKKADPGQQQKTGAAKPTYVATDKKKMKKEEMELLEYSGLVRSGIKVAGKRGGRAVQGGLKSGKTATKNAIQKKEAGKGEKIGKVIGGVVGGIAGGAAGAGAASIGTGIVGGEVGERVGGAIGRKFDKKKKEEVTEAKDKKGKGSGTKDACYHKVKSRYSVWPSAYASGALVKCRKKGAANWGNSTKKESYELSNWRDDFEATEYEFVDLIKPEPIKGGQEQIDEGQKCWKGYEKKGTKKMFGKTYNNCVKKEGYDVGDVDQKIGAVTPIPKDEREAAKQRLLAKAKAKREKMKEEKEESKVGGGNLKKLTAKAVRRVDADVDGDVDTDDMKSSETGEFVPSPDGKKKLKPKVRFEQSDWKNELEEKAKDCWDTHKKVGMKMKGGKLVNDCRPKNEETEVLEGAAWTKKSGKNKSGGLNEKGRKSYERENPGSDLKAPSKKVGNPRRKSFCARMKGMRKRQKPSNNTGDDRLSKSLRAWNC